jgi:hypothetical protein
MPAPTNEEIVEKLKTAYFELIGGQRSVSVNGRNLTLRDLKELREEIRYFDPTFAAQSTGIIVMTNRRGGC